MSKMTFRALGAGVGVFAAITFSTLSAGVAYADTPPGVLPPEIDSPVSIAACYANGVGLHQFVNPACGQVVLDGGYAIYKFFNPDPAS